MSAQRLLTGSTPGVPATLGRPHTGGRGGSVRKRGVGFARWVNPETILAQSALRFASDRLDTTHARGAAVAPWLMPAGIEKCLAALARARRWLSGRRSWAARTWCEKNRSEAAATRRLAGIPFHAAAHPAR